VSLETAEPPEARDIMPGLSDAVGPEEDTVAARLTLPANPLWLVSVMVAFPGEPNTMLRDGWSDEIMKSGPTTVTATFAV
jgi:hypothetical protein